MSGIAEEIKSRCNIIDVVGRYVKLQRAGNSYKGLCPFHNEKTPSFNVDEDRGFYHCFGCGESGDVISFIQKIENIDFITAISKLAEEFGIDMENYGYRDESKKNRIYEMNREAARFYFKNLTNSANQGYDYIIQRELDVEAVKKFGLGFAHDEWHELLDYMTEKGYTAEELLAAGLVSFSKGKYYDKFRNRVIFPIINTRGKIIGFGGRDLGNKGPKYLNSPESAAFSKQNNLFGLNLSREEISKQDFAIIVEGYMDVVSLYKNGVCNVVASLGTALTENQCKLLKRYTNNIILSYDADNAGQKAAVRGIELLRKSGLKGRVLQIPDGKDPDEYIKKHGKLAFLNLVETAQPYAEYLIDMIRRKYDMNSYEDSIAFLNEVTALLKNFTPVEVEIYIKQIAAETGIFEGAIRNQINNEQLNVTKKLVIRQEKQTLQNVGNIKVQRTFLSLATNNPEYLKQIIPYEYVFQEPVYFRIYTAVKEVYGKDRYTDIKKLLDTLEPEDSQILQEIIESELVIENSSVVLRDCIRTIKEDELNILYKEQIKILNLNPALPGNKEKIIEAEKNIIQIQKSLDEIKKSYGA